MKFIIKLLKYAFSNCWNHSRPFKTNSIAEIYFNDNILHKLKFDSRCSVQNTYNNFQMACCCVPYLVFHFFIPTSNRWLYSKKRTEEARAALIEFGRKCGADLDEKLISEAEGDVERKSSSRIYTRLGFEIVGRRA